MDIKRAEERLIVILHHRLRACLVVVSMLIPATGTPAAAGDNVTYDMQKVAPYEYNGDVRELAKAPMTTTARKPRIHPFYKPTRPQNVQSTVSPAAPELPSLNNNVPLAPMPSPSQNFPGMSFNDPCDGGQCGAGWPPDTNGDVGPSHFIQAVNDAYAIYDKTGTLLASFIEDNLWSGSGTNPCNGTSAGDPIVLYDQLADRWILTHMGWAVDGTGNPKAPFYQCIAVSKTSDPVSGGWWLYPLQMDPGGTGKPPSGTLNDYAKFGIWPDCLYMAANGFAMPSGNFSGTMYASFSRSDMESGAALTWSLGFNNDTSSTAPFTMIPSSILGVTADAMPPEGTPNYFVSEAQSTFNFEVRKFTPGTNCGGSGSLGSPVNVSQTGYTKPVSTDIVPQKGTTNKLDSLGDILMQKVRYRKIGTTESLWVVHSVQTSGTGTVVPQWAQIDVSGGTISSTPVQQQIYPDTTLYRWMGSLAVDNAGNMALGYSTSSGAQYPGIAYSGRLAADTLGTLAQTEVQLIAGGGSQTVSVGGPVHRWGDYTAMSVDPSDDCTFWYTNEYYDSPTNGSNGNWQTRIGSFKFSSCTTPAASAPTVATSAITNIAGTTATGGGNVVASGGASVTHRGVCWNISSSPTTTDGSSTCTDDGTGTGTFTSALTSLTTNSTYFVKAYATNSYGTAYGSAVSFVAVNNPPTVTTTSITGITSSSATSGGNVTSDGGLSVTDRGVCWNTTSNPTTADTCTHDGSGTGIFTSSLTGLAASTSYHVRAYAVNSLGTAYGSDLSFTASVKRPSPPTGLTVQ